MPTLQAPRPTTREPRKRRQASATPAVPAQVQEMLREISFVLHATRVARGVGQAATPSRARAASIPPSYGPRDRSEAWRAPQPSRSEPATRFEILSEEGSRR